MNQLLSVFALFLLSHPLFVAAQDAAPAEAPVETVSMVWVIAFVTLFIGAIVWFFLYLMYNERKSKQNKPE